MNIWQWAQKFHLLHQENQVKTGTKNIHEIWTVYTWKHIQWRWQLQITIEWAVLYGNIANQNQIYTATNNSIMESKSDANRVCFSYLINPFIIGRGRANSNKNTTESHWNKGTEIAYHNSWIPEANTKASKARSQRNQEQLFWIGLQSPKSNWGKSFLLCHYWRYKGTRKWMKWYGAWHHIWFGEAQANAICKETKCGFPFWFKITRVSISSPKKQIIQATVRISKAERGEF